MWKIAKKSGHGLLTKTMTVFLIAVMTFCMVPGLGMMSGMPKAYAAEPEHISGNVNVSDMIENTDYVLDGDTALYIDADLDIFSIDMDSYDLTITGDGTHTLDVQGIRGTNSVLEMRSGILEMNFGSNEAPYAAISLEGALSEFKMTGGKMDLAYTCMSYSADTVYGIHVGQFTMTGGDLSVYALVDEAASCRGIEFSDGFTMTGGTAKFVGETFENNRAGFGICGSGYVDLSMTGGELTAEGYTSGNEAYGIAVYNDKTLNTNVFGGGTVRANGSRNGIFCWAPVIIKDGAQVYANTEIGTAIETDSAEIDISGEGTYVFAESAA
ncbi:MAG: hypothetical protein IKG59_01490, partial [Firmicutes bacterium]|nr:hypothetical protein [Bacillota bacterium]